MQPQVSIMNQNIGFPSLCPLSHLDVLIVGFVFLQMSG